MLNGPLAFEFKGRRLSKITDLKCFRPSTFIYDRPNWFLPVSSNLELKNQLKIRLFEKENWFFTIEMSSDSGI